MYSHAQMKNASMYRGSCDSTLKEIDEHLDFYWYYESGNKMGGACMKMYDYKT
jgi:hypothetical protein